MTIKIENTNTMKHITYLIFMIMLFVGFTAPAQVAGDKFDVDHYEIHLTAFDFTNKAIEAEAKVTLTATATVSELVLELRRLSVEAVSCLQVEVSGFRQEDDFLFIQLSSPLQSGEQITLDIVYGGNTFNENWGGFHWSGNYAYNLGVGFESVPHNLGKAWFPCVDDFVDKASYDLYITVPEPLKAVCGGEFVSVTPDGNGNIWHWRISQDVPTYLVSVAVGEYELWEREYQGMERTIPITVYARPSQINKVDGTFVHINEIMDAFESWYGPYPFNRIGYVSTGLGCMEHVDNIAMSSNLISGGIDDGEEYYVAHELAHMWFGNLVTCSTDGDMWLNEGFATWAGYYYMRDVYGYDAYQAEMSTIINDITRTCHNQEGWIPLINMPTNLTYGTTVYQKGATVVHTMMHYLGEDVFHEGLRHYLDKYRFGSASSQDLCDALSESSGVDMNHFFENWVYTPGSPHYAMDSAVVVPNGNNYDVHIYMKATHRGAVHIDCGNRFEIAFMKDNWDFVTERIQWDEAIGHAVVTLDFNPVMIFSDLYDKTADARCDESKVLTQTGSNTYNKATFVANVNEITDSTYLRVEHHWIAPEPMQNAHPALRLSPNRYWTIHRYDEGQADIRGRFQYQRTLIYDKDLIESQADSVVLLYRQNAGQEWHSIPFEREGVWNIGYLYVDNIAPGDYTLAVWNKNILTTSENDILKNSLKAYPNPAQGQVRLQWDTCDSGCVKIYASDARLLKTASYQNVDNMVISIHDLSAGIYYVERSDLKGKVLDLTKIVVK